MALSQKHSGKMLVPWYNSHEWRYVYSLIYSDTSTKSNKQEAIEILQIWKARMPILFAGLEGTLIILNAMLQDEETFYKDDLSSFYGLAIMRFLNLCAAHGDQQGTFFRIAKARNLPEWLVNIRHDLAHSQRQSSIFMLKRGLEYCFQWLKREYWELQDKEITDFIVHEDVDEDIDHKINLYCDYVIASIANDNLPLEVTKMLREIKANKNTTSGEVLRRLVQYNKSSIEKIPNLIIENGYLFQIPFTDMDSIPHLYIQGWEPLFQYLCENDIVIKIIKQLHSICINNNDSKIRKLSSLWLNEIFKGLNVITKQSCDNSEFEVENVDVDLSYSMNLPNISAELLKELKTFASEAIETPHINFRNYFTSLMTLCGYKDDFIETMDYFLIEYFHPHHSLTTISSTPMTLDNIREIIGNSIFQNVEASSQVAEQKPKKRWKRITDTEAYEGIPIGVLPHQNRDYNPTIHF